MTAPTDTQTAAVKAHPRPDGTARAARKRRLYAGILAGFVHDLSAAARGPRPAPQRER